MIFRNLKFTTLHAHIGTFVLDPKAYGKLATKLAQFASKIRTLLGIEIQRIDIGGGFASSNTLHTQYATGEDSAPDLDEYAEAITDPLLESLAGYSEPPELFLETGRALIDEAGYLVATVVGNKRLPNGFKGVIVDAGVNVLFTSFWYRHDVSPVRDNGSLQEETVVYGPLCMNIDVLRPSVLLPNQEPGDLLVFKNVGAYNMTQWLQFIRMRPAVVLIDTDEMSWLIREAEDISDLKRRERLPDYLKLNP